MSAEYIMAGGNENVILCERGIRTFETYTRNTLDLSAVPVLHNLTHLPVDHRPKSCHRSCQSGKTDGALRRDCGADGLMIEVHNNPAKALCDGPQSLTPAQFAGCDGTGEKNQRGGFRESGNCRTGPNRRFPCKSI